jgi:glycosyltransferase involved in cell wall biosynthesis
MSNAAIYLHPEGYDTRRALLMGRHSAGESFLRGFLRHAQVDEVHLWNAGGRPEPELRELIARVAPEPRPLRFIDMRNRRRFEGPGAVYLPHPDLGREAWQRQPFGSWSYGICGITHTTASADVQAQIGDLLIAPTEPYDALICTSKAVRTAVETQLDAFRDHLARQFGPRRKPEPMRTTIPLGINCDDFVPSPEHRKAWRERLSIPDDAVVALYVGRFSLFGKMNPALMALALERAAQATDRPIVWLLSGWGEDPEAVQRFHSASAALCPSVRYLPIDGRPPDVRFSIWSAADLFISLSDNVQETFGLTPVEAMAAGLPSVVTDWNGYKDTVRHGVDGFRIRTIAPRPGLGQDLAFRYNNAWINYDLYVGAAAQFTAVDLAAASEAIVALAEDPNLRARMGAAAQARAREAFDWSAIIPQYQALWAEQNAIRAATPRPPPEPVRDNPWRMDPFRLFANYPTQALQARTRIALAPGMSPAAGRAILASPLAAFITLTFPSGEEVDQVLAFLEPRGEVEVAEVLATFPPGRRFFIERALLWLAKFGVIVVEGSGPAVEH